MDDELLRRAEDLSARAARSGTVTHTAFLTPAEQHALRSRAAYAETVFSGGYPDAERQVAFFLPEWMDADAFDPAEYLCAIELTVRFGAPGHRDVLGATLALGVERDRLGDILIDGERAWLFCLPTVKAHLLLNLDRIGRWGAAVQRRCVR